MAHVVPRGTFWCPQEFTQFGSLEDLGKLCGAAYDKVSLGQWAGDSGKDLGPGSDVQR